jgi:hypothetical protein
MRRPRRMLIVLAAVAGLAASLLTTAPAQAAYFGSETNYAVSSGAPSGTEGEDYYCARPHTGVVACFDPDGDIFYVADTVGDGKAAVAEFTIYGSDGNLRSGSCVNKLNAGNWGTCNKDFVENREGTITGALYDSGNFVSRGSRNGRFWTG